MIRLLGKLKKREALYLLLCAVLVLVQVWLDLRMPDYTSALTAAVSTGNATMDVIVRNGTMMLLCALASMVSSLTSGYFSARISAGYARTLRNLLFDRITDFSQAEYNRFTTSSLITRTTNDVMQMQSLYSIGLQMLIRAPITAAMAITKISSTSVEWTAATLITVAVIVVLLGSVILVSYPKFQIIQKLTDGLNSATRENVAGVRVIRAFNADRYQNRKFEKVNSEITDTQLFTSRAMSLMSPIMTLCMSGLTLAIYWIGALLINRAEVQERAVVIGNMTAYTQYAMQIVMSFMMLLSIFIFLPRVLVSAKRINEVLDTEPSITYPEEEVETDRKGEIEFRNVAFAYADDSRPCIRDISFKVEKGQTFAVIGATGTGKSTLINLIPRLFDATGGQVLIDGRDIREYPKKQLEKMISIAPQKAILFTGDILSNVAYGCSEGVADDDPGLMKALRVAHADFVDDLEQGVHAPVAQGGTNFSGGQKQRLSIARAVYRDAEIVIFDDTFSALDYKTDMLVRKSLKEELEGTTVIIVAQRIGTIKNADCILVLDKGTVAGLGTHEQLLANCAVYKEIALSQLSEEEL